MNSSKHSLKYQDQLIRVNPQTDLVNLVDMWKAAGADPSKKPVHWFRGMPLVPMRLTVPF